MYKKILEKPESYRRKLAIILTAIIGILIFAIWLFITQFQLRQSIEREPITNPSDLEEFEKSLPNIPVKNNSDKNPLSSKQQ